MANPNIAALTSVLGETTGILLTTTTNTLIINNPAASGNVLKINTIKATNVNISANSSVFLNWHDEDDIGGTAFILVHNLFVNARNTRDLLEEGYSFYLTENRSISVRAGLVDSLEISASYDIITDV